MPSIFLAILNLPSGTPKYAAIALALIAVPLVVFLVRCCLVRQNKRHLLDLKCIYPFSPWSFAFGWTFASLANVIFASVSIQEIAQYPVVGAVSLVLAVTLVPVVNVVTEQAGTKRSHMQDRSYSHDDELPNFIGKKNISAVEFVPSSGIAVEYPACMHSEILEEYYSSFSVDDNTPDESDMSLEPVDSLPMEMDVPILRDVDLLRLRIATRAYVEGVDENKLLCTYFMKTGTHSDLLNQQPVDWS